MEKSIRIKNESNIKRFAKLLNISEEDVFDYYKVEEALKGEDLEQFCKENNFKYMSLWCDEEIAFISGHYGTYGITDYEGTFVADGSFSKFEPLIELKKLLKEKRML